MDELSGLELRKAAHEAVGLRPFRREGAGRSETPDGGFHVWWMPGDGFEGLLGAATKPEDVLPPAESDLGAAWPLLVRWRAKKPRRSIMFGVSTFHAWAQLQQHSTDGLSVTKWDGSASVEDSDETALATAICRALVAVGGE